MFVIKHLRTTRKEKRNKTGRVVAHWSARVATVVSQTGDETDGTRVSEIPARDTVGHPHRATEGKGMGYLSHLTRRGPELGKRNGTA